MGYCRWCNKGSGEAMLTAIPTFKGNRYPPWGSQVSIAETSAEPRSRSGLAEQWPGIDRYRDGAETADTGRGRLSREEDYPYTASLSPSVLAPILLPV